MNIQLAISKIKELIAAKGILNLNPENGAQAVVVREQKLGTTYSAGVAVGRIQAINVRYFDVQGFVYEDTFAKWDESNLRIEPKTINRTKGLSYTAAVFTKDIVRATDEAKWADKFKNLEDFIEVLEKLE
jgi:hypothetical protein